jgi:flagellar biosynthesis/type III secretory pathway protein FliH
MGVYLSFGTKLASFAGREAELAKDENPFAWLTLAWLQFRAARHDKLHQLAVKFNLIRALFRKQWDKAQIREFLHIMDWMTSLPPELTNRLDSMVETLESEQNMEYIDSITRLRMARGEAAAHQQGQQQGQQQGMTSLLAKLLKNRFQNLPDWVAAKLNQASTDDIVRWAERVLTAPTLEAVFANETH